MIVKTIEIKDKLFGKYVVDRRTSVTESNTNEVFKFLKNYLKTYYVKKFPEILWVNYNGNISLLKGNIKIEVDNFLSIKEHIYLITLLKGGKNVK